MHMSDTENGKASRLVMVAHACNPSKLGGTDQEDHGSWPARQKISNQ
jgi:hypothetical protein